MFGSGNTPVPDTEENRQLCRQYCTNCENYRHHHLEEHEPGELFCAKGTSGAEGMREIGCFCPACELFIKHHLRGGFFCVRH